MKRTENLFKYLVKKLNINTIKIKGQEIDLRQRFKRINMVDAVSKATGEDFRNISLEKAIEIAKKHKIKIEKFFKVGHIINAFLKN